MTRRDEESFHMVLSMTGGFRESLVTLAILTPCLVAASRSSNALCASTRMSSS